MAKEGLEEEEPVSSLYNKSHTSVNKKITEVTSLRTFPQFCAKFFYLYVAPPAKFKFSPCYSNAVEDMGNSQIIFIKTQAFSIPWDQQYDISENPAYSDDYVFLCFECFPNSIFCIFLEKRKPYKLKMTKQASRKLGQLFKIETLYCEATQIDSGTLPKMYLTQQRSSFHG